MLNVFLIQSLVIFFYAIGWFVISIEKNRNDVADVAWGGGFACVALVAYMTHGTGESRAILVLFLVLLWGARLVMHIGGRNRGKPEDHRYKIWRQEWGRRTFRLRSFLQVFLLQGLLILIISLPVTWSIVQNGPPLNLLDAVGLCLWLTGLFFEAVGDYQLLRFKKNPENKGRIMKSGLWHYTRHPNYFGEVLLWWGIFLICLSVPLGWWTVIGPLTLTWLILRVSGAPMLEKKFADDPEYAEYIRTTSVFFPLPPEKKGA